VRDMAWRQRETHLSATIKQLYLFSVRHVIHQKAHWTKRPPVA
jgi:hypothetical protein